MDGITDIQFDELPVWRCQEECCGEQWATREEGTICPFCHIGPGAKAGFTCGELIKAKERYGFRGELPVHIPVPVPDLIQLSQIPREHWVGLPVYHPCSQGEEGCNWLLYDVGVVVGVRPYSNPNSPDKFECTFVTSEGDSAGTLEYKPSNLWVPSSVAKRLV